MEQPAAFLISDEVVNDILRTGSGQKNTLFHITARLIEGLDNEEMRSFLKDEYGTGGKGFTIDGQKSVSGMTMMVSVSGEGTLPEETLTAWLRGKKQRTEFGICMRMEITWII